jgi:hypothetical protein
MNADLHPDDRYVVAVQSVVNNACDFVAGTKYLNDIDILDNIR